MKQCPSGTLHSAQTLARPRGRGPCADSLHGHRLLSCCCQQCITSRAEAAGGGRRRRSGPERRDGRQTATGASLRVAAQGASEQDEHTRRSRATPTILALEPSLLIPIYLVHAASLMFLCDRKRVFTPRGDPVNVRRRQRQRCCVAFPMLRVVSMLCHY